jgi:hypothetical protein
MTADQRHLSLPSRLVLKFIGLSATLSLKLKSLTLDIDVQHATSEFISIIPAIVDQMEAIATAGILVFMHDVTSVALSQITLEVYKVCLGFQLRVDARSSGDCRPVRETWQ